MKVGFNLAMVCIIALLCLAAIAITGLAMGYNGTLMALSFAAVGAVPAGLIAWQTARVQNGKDKKKGEDEQ